MLTSIQFPSKRGFTIIELIVVFSVIAIISTIGIASFVSYTNSQKLRNAVLEVKTALQDARSQALSQTRPNTCNGTLDAYEVRICCKSSGTGCPSCITSGDYEIDAICSNVAVNTSFGTLPSDVTFSSTQTTQRTFHFVPIVGGVTNSGTIGITQSNTTQTINVTSTGVIQ